MSTEPTDTDAPVDAYDAGDIIEVDAAFAAEIMDTAIEGASCEEEAIGALVLAAATLAVIGDHARDELLAFVGSCYDGVNSARKRAGS